MGCVVRPAAEPDVEGRIHYLASEEDCFCSYTASNVRCKCMYIYISLRVLRQGRFLIFICFTQLLLDRRLQAKIANETVFIGEKCCGACCAGVSHPLGNRSINLICALIHLGFITSFHHLNPKFLSLKLIILHRCRAPPWQRATRCVSGWRSTAGPTPALRSTCAWRCPPPSAGSLGWSVPYVTSSL